MCPDMTCSSWHVYLCIPWHKEPFQWPTQYKYVWIKTMTFRYLHFSDPLWPKKRNKNMITLKQWYKDILNMTQEWANKSRTLSSSFNKIFSNKATLFYIKPSKVIFSIHCLEKVPFRSLWYKLKSYKIGGSEVYVPSDVVQMLDGAVVGRVHRLSNTGLLSLH